MFIMFADESGDTGLINSQSSFFALTGLVVHELRWRACLDQILNFRRKLRNEVGLKLSEEINFATRAFGQNQKTFTPEDHS
jgi:uncharacterized protein DUF3800